MSQPLPPDTGADIDVDLEAMRRDAEIWRAAAVRMGEAAAVAKGLQLSGYVLSNFAEETGLTDAYRDMQQWVVGLLDGAHKNLASLADALTNTAATYQDADAGGGSAFSDIAPGGN